VRKRALSPIRVTAFLAILFCLLALVLPIGPAAAKSSGGQCGSASWYALTSKTASGDPMNPSALTAAHRTLPFGSRVAVTNEQNGRTVVVTINDRGPFVKGRIIDLSRAAATVLGFRTAGHTRVCIAAA
jgi:peptidoglycan lytic transglycosylase